MVAGYCWEWPSRRAPLAWDIEIPKFEYRRRWNLDTDGSLWIVALDSVQEVGCIHTCQGLELDYVGVIIGPDLFFEDGRIDTDPKRRARSDASLKGLGTMMRDDRLAARAVADRIIKNTYRTLMTRGMRGCYVYCTDPSLADYLRSRLRPLGTGESANPTSMSATSQVEANVVPLRPVTESERAAGVPSVPVVELRFAAVAFSDPQALESGAIEWVALPSWIRQQPGLFVAQVVGESMNRRIPNGAWCLFRANPSGTRQGKIVVAEHRDIDDPETGGRYTIKRYSSEKVLDTEGGWRHERIVLKPESDRTTFEPIVIEIARGAEFTIVAEWLTTLGEAESA